MCKCGEGKFVRTANMAIGGEGSHPFTMTFLNAKPGTVCLAPPVHDCEYIRVRNQLSTEALRLAWQKFSRVSDGPAREAAVQRLWQEETRRLVDEYYASK